ncbi:MAG: MCE family protein [Gordonia sp. (in: high G+C Gram-positive bacteria)]
MRAKKRLASAAVALATVISLSACSVLPGITVEQIPLPAPGGLGSGMTVKASFANALNLPAMAKVRLGGTDVGQVTAISAKNYRAEVTMDVRSGLKLPVGTGAELRQATPLGDVFVALMPPKDASKGYLRSGDTLGGDTSAAATVEDLLVAITAQVDSGSVSSLQRIFTELSTAVSGNSTELAGAISGFTEAITKFNQNADNVDKAMVNTANLTKELADGREQIAASINKLPPAINAVNDQLGLILDTLDKSNKVTAATNDFLSSQQDNFAEMLGHLNTALEALNNTAPQLGPLMDRLVTLNPKWRNSTLGSAASVSAKLYWITPGVGFDSRSRFPELQDVDMGLKSLQQTLTIILARLTGTMGAG